MTKRDLGVALATCLVLIFIIGHAKESSDAEESENPVAVEVMKTITMTTPEDAEDTQPSATFSHLGHAMDIGCATCHHQWDYEEEASPRACSSCHSDFESRQGEESYFNAFHNRKAETSCLGCHGGATQQEGETAGPIKCPDCHVRE